MSGHHNTIKNYRFFYTVKNYRFKLPTHIRKAKKKCLKKYRFTLPTHLISIHVVLHVFVCD